MLDEEILENRKKMGLLDEEFSKRIKNINLQINQLDSELNKER